MLMLASDYRYDLQKKNKKNHSYNKPVELTYHKAGMLIQYPRTYKTKKVTSINVSGSKGGKRNFHDVWKSKFCGSFFVNYDSSNNV